MYIILYILFWENAIESKIAEGGRSEEAGGGKPKGVNSK
jgi:hypothetical protein